MEYATAPNWELIDEATKALMLEKPDGIFTRKEIIDYINNVLLEGKKPRKESSLNPMIQAVTVNAPGGAPGGLGKNLLYRVARGLYKRYDPSKDAEDDEMAAFLGLTFLSDIDDSDVPVSRVDERGAILLPKDVMQRLNVVPGNLVGFFGNEVGQAVLRRVRLKLEVVE